MSYKVLQVGLDPVAVEQHPSFSATFPSVDGETIRAGIAASRAELERRGFTIDVCLVDHGATAETVFREALTRSAPDVVVIGGGVRLEPALTHLFEVLVNAARELAPRAVLAFNTSPDSTDDAVLRWLPERSPLADATG